MRLLALVGEAHARSGWLLGVALSGLAAPDVGPVQPASITYFKSSAANSRTGKQLKARATAPPVARQSSKRSARAVAAAGRVTQGAQIHGQHR